MKYTTSVEIDRPIEEVVALFDNSENLYKWMKGLKSMEHLSGEEGKAGAKSHMVFETGKRRIEMVETIDDMNLPDNMSCTYEAKGVTNIQHTRFEKVDDNKTRYVCDNEFQFRGFMKIMGLMMPGAFKKQSLQYQKDFKAFAEAQ
jgi:uncharacterized membrane protein